MRLFSFYDYISFVARVIIDHSTGRSRGFGFVSYTSSEDATSAKNAMDGQVYAYLFSRILFFVGDNNSPICIHLSIKNYMGWDNIEYYMLSHTLGIYMGYILERTPSIKN